MHFGAAGRNFRAVFKLSNLRIMLLKGGEGPQASSPLHCWGANAHIPRRSKGQTQG